MSRLQPSHHLSPLRYPGGKAVLAPVLADLLVANDLHDGTIVEPFAGGAGASLELLLGEYVGQVVLNDADPRLTTFWRVALNRTEELVERIQRTRATMATWRRCKQVYDAGTRKRSHIDLAFAVFFLNRCNRSGVIVNGGPIGGHDQTGEWKLDARFNQGELIARLRRLAKYREQITVTTLDARDLLHGKSGFEADYSLVFLDPPYYEKGQRLYLNSLDHKDHVELAEILLDEPSFRWVLTYDDVPAIRDLYARLNPRMFTLGYSAYKRRVGRELIVFDPRLVLPHGLFSTRKSVNLRFGRIAG